jgi:hypothetical protein
MKGSVNLTRLTHVLRGDMAMLYASSNRREIHTPCLVPDKLTSIQ